MSQAESVNVAVTVGDVKVQFSGSAESVMASVMSFLSKQVPSMDLAKKISLSYSAQELIEAYAHLIKITPEGPRVIPAAASGPRRTASSSQIRSAGQSSSRASSATWT